MYRKVLYNTCHNVPWVYCTNLLGSILITTTHTHTHTHCVISTGAGKAGISFFHPLSIFLLTCVRRMRRAGKGGGFQHVAPVGEAGGGGDPKSSAAACNGSGKLHYLAAATSSTCEPRSAPIRPIPCVQSEGLKKKRGGVYLVLMHVDQMCGRLKAADEIAEQWM
jgi:hypothetical protein